MIEKCKKFANKKVASKRSVQNWSLSSSILLTCKSFWQITFSRYTFFKLFPRIWNQRKILRLFWYSNAKKEIKNFGVMEYIIVFFGNSRMQNCKKWLNQLKNFFNKYFKECYLASFCWWIPSSCENHCNLVRNAAYNRIQCRKLRCAGFAARRDIFEINAQCRVQQDTVSDAEVRRFCRESRYLCNKCAMPRI